MTIQEDLVELARMKEYIDSVDADKAELEARIIKEMVASGKRTISTNNGDLTGTLVKSSTITVDEAKLKAALPAALWKKVTKQVLDKERLEAHIVTGDIDANIVAGVSTEKDRRPYIKVTGTFRPKKTTTPRSPASTTNSNGGTKPAAKKRVVRPKK